MSAPEAAPATTSPVLPDGSPQERAAALLMAMRGAALTLGTCESLTGGGVAQLLTSVPGASAVFRGALVTYASDLKASLAGVDAALIAQHGVINGPTAAQMASGARRALAVDLAIACTGVAGPDPQDGEPAGTVWIAGSLQQQGNAAEAEERLEIRQLQLRGLREQIRLGTAQACLDLAYHMVMSRDFAREDIPK